MGRSRYEVDDATLTPTGRSKVMSKLGALAYRPGFHFGSIPYAPHIYTKKPNFDDEKKPENLDKHGHLREDYDYSQTRYMKDDTVWVECSISFDVDYNERAKQNGTYISSHGKTVVNPRLAYLPHVPTDGAYIYRTNSRAPQWMTWYIAGSFRINRILSDQEIDVLCKAHNVNMLQRKENE